ncbi:related to arabinan endo-1,5-alpha-L-arabinosidase A precursor [Rhynchosporium graminicola]|uniref:Arabinan endo-1,5-alpha-L-arabinosidase n=1 Tax=Rhynchosporium graminicola TaxID=2792576 RepID=A0A1E1JQG0_9HELO|nr:related to arabinan endo-1,5-alpha-L-arabinosidase A precursor [Rhynchosporium commune]
MFQSLNRVLFAISAVLPALIQAYSNPGSCSGACWAHDPAIIQRASDGQYYKFNTGGNIEIATATNLAGPWTLKGFVLSDGSSISSPGNKDCWAPDVSLVNGVYHLYYSVSTFGTQTSAIGLATSSTLDPGSWTDLGAIGVTSSAGKSYNAIDANLIAVGSSYYLNFGSFWHDIYQIQLNAAATRAGGAAAYNLEYGSTNRSPSEGSYMFYHSGFYYLTWSLGICCNYEKTKPAAGLEYKIMMCRSTTATGGFVDKNGRSCTAGGGSVLLESHGDVYGPGGQGVFNDKSKGLVLYYHYANPNVGLADGKYLFGWNVLTWAGGWPSV